MTMIAPVMVLSTKAEASTRADDNTTVPGSSVPSTMFVTGASLSSASRPTAPGSGALRCDGGMSRNQTLPARIPRDDGGRGRGDCLVGGVAKVGEQASVGLEIPDLERLVLGRRDAETACRPSGVTAHAVTQRVWPASVASARPVASSQIVSVWSRDAETTCRPSGRHRARGHPAGVAFKRGQRAPGRQLPVLKQMHSRTLQLRNPEHLG